MVKKFKYTAAELQRRWSAYQIMSRKYESCRNVYGKSRKKVDSQALTAVKKKFEAASDRYFEAVGQWTADQKAAGQLLHLPPLKTPARAKMRIDVTGYTRKKHVVKKHPVKSHTRKRPSTRKPSSKKKR